MFCYRDMTFCTDADTCKSKWKCERFLNPAEAYRANSLDMPIALGSFKEFCKYYVEEVEVDEDFS